MTSVNSATSAAQSQANLAATNLASTADQFLLLLTTQLKNQDPLKPMDSTQFTQQLVELTGVQQSIATNKNLEQLLGFYQANQNASLVNYIGKSVEANGDVTTLSNGSAQWHYDLPQDAANVTLTVTDADGKTVVTKTGDTAKGGHDFLWDGKSSNQLPAPDGDYTLTVTATDASGATINAATKVSGTVSSIESANGEQVLVVGGQRVRLSDVLSVTQATQQ